MLCTPTASVDTGPQLAVAGFPGVRATATQPAMGAAPSWKVTDPPGFTPETLTVNVTPSPERDGLTDDASDSVAGSGLTTCVTVFDVLAGLLASPP